MSLPVSSRALDDWTNAGAHIAAVRRLVDLTNTRLGCLDGTDVSVEIRGHRRSAGVLQDIHGFFPNLRLHLGELDDYAERVRELGWLSMEGDPLSATRCVAAYETTQPLIDAVRHMRSLVEEADSGRTGLGNGIALTTEAILGMFNAGWGSNFDPSTPLRRDLLKGLRTLLSAADTASAFALHVGDLEHSTLPSIELDVMRRSERVPKEQIDGWMTLLHRVDDVVDDLRNGAMAPQRRRATADGLGRSLMLNARSWPLPSKLIAADGVKRSLVCAVDYAGSGFHDAVVGVQQFVVETVMLRNSDVTPTRESPVAARPLVLE